MAEPPYVRIAGDLEKKIRSGELAPGERLRAVNYLAHDYGVNKNTVVKAQALLKEKGLLESVQGYGTFVSDPVPGA